jgi:hypothetical protein
MNYDIKFEEIDSVVPSPEVKQIIVKLLEDKVFKYADIYKLGIVDSILKICDDYNFRVEDIEDYVEASNLIKQLANVGNISNDNKLKQLGFF